MDPARIQDGGALLALCAVSYTYKKLRLKWPEVKDRWQSRHDLDDWKHEDKASNRDWDPRPLVSRGLRYAQARSASAQVAIARRRREFVTGEPTDAEVEASKARRAAMYADISGPLPVYYEPEEQYPTGTLRAIPIPDHTSPQGWPVQKRTGGPMSRSAQKLAPVLASLEDFGGDVDAWIEDMRERMRAFNIRTFGESRVIEYETSQMMPIRR